MTKPIEKSKNYFQVILKNGKTHPKLYKSPLRALREVGSENIKMLREVLAEQVNAKYADIDAITGTKENEL
jgi:hypothetical protein